MQHFFKVELVSAKGEETAFRLRCIYRASRGPRSLEVWQQAQCPREGEAYHGNAQVGWPSVVLGFTECEWICVDIVPAVHVPRRRRGMS